MKIILEKVNVEDKDILYRMLQFALYDGSFYIDNEINDKAIFEYKYFNDYFIDTTRDKYFIKNDKELIGFVMINENNKFNTLGKTIAEFLIMPKYRRNHLGKEAAKLAFEIYHGNWEVQPMENNPIAYSFWKSTIAEYTNNNYRIKNDGIEDVFIFKN